MLLVSEQQHQHCPQQNGQTTFVETSISKHVNKYQKRRGKQGNVMPTNLASNQKDAAEILMKICFKKKN